MMGEVYNGEKASKMLLEKPAANRNILTSHSCRKRLGRTLASQGLPPQAKNKHTRATPRRKIANAYSYRLSRSRNNPKAENKASPSNCHT